MKRAIALIGMAGSGKTTVGRVLAPLVGMPCVDTDERIEQKCGRTIADIFACEGEAYFRGLESEEMRALCDTPCIMSLGGGAVINEDAMRAVKAAAYVVWVRTGLSTCLARVTGDTARPLAARTQELYQKREPLYRAFADLTVDADALSPTQIATVIYGAWKKENG